MEFRTIDKGLKIYTIIFITTILTIIFKDCYNLLSWLFSALFKICSLYYLSFRFSKWDILFWMWHAGLRVELIYLPVVLLAIDINALVAKHNNMIFSQQNLYFVLYVLLYNIMSCYCFCAIGSWKINSSLWNCFSPWNLIFKSSLVFPVWWDNFGSWLCQLSICYCHVSDVTLISMY